ncbi:hypothetical protein ACFCXT_06315 [Streptomyces vinaceus]
MPLTTVMERLDIAESTASEIRKEALVLLLSGCGVRDAAVDAAYEPEGRG